jgi:hypothetical protein
MRTHAAHGTEEMIIQVEPVSGCLVGAPSALMSTPVEA